MSDFYQHANNAFKLTGWLGYKLFFKIWGKFGDNNQKNKDNLK